MGRMRRIDQSEEILDHPTATLTPPLTRNQCHAFTVFRQVGASLRPLGNRAFARPCLPHLLIAKLRCTHVHFFPLQRRT